MQLLGCVAAVGVHLDQHRVLAAQPPREAGQVGGAEPVLALAVHDVHAVGVGQRQFVGELTGAVRAAVVDDEDVDVGPGLVHPADDQRQVLPLVVGGDDDQTCADSGVQLARGRSCGSSFGATLVGRCVVTAGVGRPTATTHEPSIVQHRGDQSPDPDRYQQALDPRTPPSRGRELRLQPDRHVEVGRLEELRCGPARDRRAR